MHSSYFSIFNWFMNWYIFRNKIDYAVDEDQDMPSIKKKFERYLQNVAFLCE
jgi:hypothetical protein